MNVGGRVVLVVALLAARSAHAQESTLFAGASATMWVFEGDIEDTADASPGVRAEVGYWLRPFVAIIGAVDYLIVTEKQDVPGGDMRFYSFELGTRVTTPWPTRFKPYAELLLGRYTLDIARIVDSESDVGFHAGAGVTCAVHDKLLITAGVGRTSVSIDAGFGDTDVDAFVFSAGMQGRF